MPQVPLLILSDAPTSATGLGRITRELTARIYENLSDVFRVGTFGFAGPSSRHFPWQQYQIHRLDNWVAPELPIIWKDFAGDEKGILLSIWNPGWSNWLSNPKDNLPPSGLRDFLMKAPFEKWIYAPIDAEGVDGRMQQSIVEVLSGFDRVLFYTQWANDLYSVGEGRDSNWIPHGIDEKVFYPRDARQSRRNFVNSVSGRHEKPLRDDVKIIGIVATNSARKDWGLGFEACAQLLADGHNIGIWAHTDSFQKHWDLVGMANEFGLARRVIFTNGNLSDETMALAYSGCDVTLGIGSGEGFGYPLAESLACGTPVIHGDYAGGAEMVPTMFRVPPATYRWDGGMYFARRPVFYPHSWAASIVAAFENKSDSSLLTPGYYWSNLWSMWEKWLTNGIKA